MGIKGHAREWRAQGLGYDALVQALKLLWLVLVHRGGAVDLSQVAQGPHRKASTGNGVLDAKFSVASDADRVFSVVCMAQVLATIGVSVGWALLNLGTEGRLEAVVVSSLLVCIGKVAMSKKEALRCGRRSAASRGDRRHIVVDVHGLVKDDGVVGHREVVCCRLLGE